MTRVWRALERGRHGAVRPPRAERRRRRDRDAHPAGQAVHGLQPVSPLVAAGAAPRGAGRAAQAARAAAEVRKGRIPSLATWGSSRRSRSRCRAARRPARERLSRSCAGVGEYTDNHDALGPRQDLAPLGLPALRLHLAARGGGAAAAGKGPRPSAASSAGATSTTTCCCHFPRNARTEFQQRYRGASGGTDAEQAFEAWREGRTGYPLVDAGMRQLRREGWMHNRARLVVGSFLTKDLGSTGAGASAGSCAC